MYENLSIQDYIERMNKWDNKRAASAEDWIEEHWTPGETFTLESGTIIQYKNFRGDLNGISKN